MSPSMNSPLPTLHRLALPLLLVAGLSGTALAAPPQLEIEAYSVESNFQSGHSQFRGQVQVRTQDYELDADRLDVYLDTSDTAGDNRLQRLHASGSVEIRQQDQQGTGTELQYDHRSNTFVLSGDPAVLLRPDSRLEAPRIELDRTTGRISVQGQGQSRVRLQIEEP